jgi:hypothetical protein
MPLGFALACSSNAGAPSSSDAGDELSPTDAGGQPAPEAAAGTAVVHGIMVDYESLRPVAALTVTSGNLTTTTDDAGVWSLNVPVGSAMNVTVTKTPYSLLLFPDLVPVDPDVDLATIVIPDSPTFTPEEEVLPDADPTKALVQVVVLTQPTCASAAGGTLTVTSPSSASVAYFDPSSANPSTSIRSFQTVKNGRPVAVVYNLDPTATLAVPVSHPTCKQVSYPATYGGRRYPRTVPLQPMQPGGVNSALTIVLE